MGVWKSLINVMNIVIFMDGVFFKVNIILKIYVLNNEIRIFWYKIFFNFWKEFINYEVIKKIVYENINSFYWYFNV